jgi:hypothetical protein
VQTFDAGDVDDRAAVERVDEHSPVHSIPQQEVTRKVHGCERHAAAPTDLERQHRQRDGQASAAVEDLVEIGVARVVVVVAFAVEALVDEEEAEQTVERRWATSGRQVVEATQLGGDIDIGIAVGGDDEEGGVEGHLWGGTGDQAGPGVGWRDGHGVKLPTAGGIAP